MNANLCVWILYFWIFFGRARALAYFFGRSASGSNFIGPDQKNPN